MASAEHPTVFDPSTLVRKGLCPVTSIRNKGDPFESHSLYYEQHGSGPEKLVFIMGMNSSSFSWLPQVAHFGRLSNYSLLVFDNRGVGNSGVPRGPYTTSGMAADVIALLDYVGWTEERDLHIIGISMGGMIAQELAIRIPERIISMSLAVTTSGGFFWNNFPPVKGATSLAKLLTIKEPENKVPVILDMVFPTEWLEEKVDGDLQGRTNRQVQEVLYLYRIKATRPQGLVGSLSQMCAAMTHHVSPAQLRELSASIPKVLIMTGDQDNLVAPHKSRFIKAHMPEAALIVMSVTGHAIQIQRAERFNALLESAFEEGRERLKKKRT